MLSVRPSRLRFVRSLPAAAGNPQFPSGLNLSTSQQYQRGSHLNHVNARRARLTRHSPLNLSTPQPLNHSSPAFTLIELLVVITIIVILMGLLFPAFRGAQDQAKRAQAKNDLSQIVTAVNAYYTEYGKYPVLGTANSTPNDFWIGDWNSADLFNVLRANGLSWDNISGDNLNPKRVVFLNPPTAKDSNAPRGGISQSNGKYYDPWGSTYRLRIDWDYDNALTNPYAAGAGGNSLNFGVIAYSIGKDQVSGADSNNGKYKVVGQTNDGDDDVLSWQ